MNSPATRPLWSRIADVANLIATPLKPSHYVELVQPLWTTHTLQARVEDVRHETKDCCTLTLRPSRNWRAHRAGQFVRLGVTIDGVRHTRTYSISSSPDRNDDCITITVKAVEGGRVSPYLVYTIKPGAYVALGLPQGDFVLPDAVPVRPLFITAGSGITPIMSMLRTYASRQHMPDVAHIHYAPQAHAVIFGKELAQLSAAHPSYRLQQVYTARPEADAKPVRSEHFSPAQLEALCPDWRTREIWACGPETLLSAVEQHVAAEGRARQLHLERFHAAFAALPNDGAGGRVRFTASGREAQADGRVSLLRVAEDAGLSPQHGCRMGICHTCDVALVSGCVRDLRTGALHDEPGQTIQPCVCAAASDVELAL